jgi:hypothetical protein
MWEVSELDLDVAFSATYLPRGPHLISRSTRLTRTREQAHGPIMEELSRSRVGSFRMGAPPLRRSTTPGRGLSDNEHTPLW